MRYALQMITAASMVSQKRKAASVEVEDINRVYALFADVKRSTQAVIEHQSEYLFNEGDSEDESEDEMEQV